jgi:ATP-dependent RNA helicase RhlE
MDGITADAIHGNKSQGARTRALANFKQGKIRALVATDIAARGIDIDLLPHVVNYELPNVPEDYVHRIGRTGRAGSEGEAVSLVSGEERSLLRDIERLLKQTLPRAQAEGFTPAAHHLAEAAERPSHNAHAPRQARPNAGAGRHHHSHGNHRNRSKKRGAQRSADR